MSHCWDLPPHTFGGAYAQFMGTRGFKADDRPVVRCVGLAILLFGELFLSLVDRRQLCSSGALRLSIDCIVSVLI